MSRDDLTKAMRRIHEAIERAIAPLVHESADGEGAREIFITVVTGWFPVGLRILAALSCASRTLPNASGAGEEQLSGLLRAWCDRYLPEDPAGPSDLGVRVEKR
jgi:hypothetical protein